jgi:Uma2 family endonuclease
MSRAAALREYDDSQDHIIVLHGVPWEDYKRVLAIRGEHSAPRISYLEGELEIMSPGQDHEAIKTLIGRLLEAWCMDRGIEVMAFGNWTLKQEKTRSGVEADECYIFGTERPSRPHLAIEVEWTPGGIDKLAIYEKLGVEEVWWWRKGVIEVYVLRKGTFVSAKRSGLFPDLDLELLTSMLDRDTISQAVRDFRKALAHDPQS